MLVRLWWIGCLVFVFAAGEDKTITVNVLQLNDVYEMAGVGSGDSVQGGLARVANLRRQLAAEHPTLTMLAGDLISPSAIGLAEVDGERLAGKQMIAVVNAMGLNYMAFGNHEFDVKQAQLLARLNESEFVWVASNVRRADGTHFPKAEDHVLVDVAGRNGKLKLGIFSVTLDSNPQTWVRYDMDLAGIARDRVAKLRKAGADVVVALTHLNIKQDLALAQDVDGIDLIVGGHEHENMLFYRGRNFTPVAKADANARTVYIHQIQYHPDSSKVEVASRLRIIDHRLARDESTKAVIDKWTTLAFASYREQGVEPERVVTVAGADLDGTALAVRNGGTELTRILAAGMVAGMQEVEASIYNSGTIRIDDVIPEGQTITEYDVLRIMPFGGKVKRVEMLGSLLIKVLDQGVVNKGSGGFLQYAQIEHGHKGWSLMGEPIQPGKKYRIAMLDFLLSGKEQGLGYLTADNPDLKLLDGDRDVRKILVEQLRRTYGEAKN